MVVFVLQLLLFGFFSVRGLRNKEMKNVFNYVMFISVILFLVTRLMGLFYYLLPKLN